MTDVENYSESTFERIKRYTDDGVEYWSARDLMVVLVYSTWQKFVPVIEKAKQSCKTSGEVIHNHFNHAVNMVEAGSGAYRESEDINLSRYACYLIVQNGDPSKPMIALGQTYFAIKTREQELSEFATKNEDGRRLELRGSIKGFNRKLADTAQRSGVINFGRFQNFGYRGLYNGESAGDIKRRKRLRPSQDILDHMGATELAANYFRVTQTEEKLRNEDIQGEDYASLAHYSVGRAVRKTMLDISGIAPEELPTPDKSIKQLERDQKKLGRSPKVDDDE